jgi:hypothetical protein
MFDSFDQNKVDEVTKTVEKKNDVVSRPISQASGTASKISVSHRGSKLFYLFFFNFSLITLQILKSRYECNFSQNIHS